MRVGLGLSLRNLSWAIVSMRGKDGDRVEQEGAKTRTSCFGDFVCLLLW